MTSRAKLPKLPITARVPIIVGLAAISLLSWGMHGYFHTWARLNQWTYRGALHSNANRYFEEFGRYPQSLGTLVARCKKRNIRNACDLANPWGHPYIWHVSSNGSEAYFRDLGRDGTPSYETDKSYYLCRENTKNIHDKNSDVDRDYELFLRCEQGEGSKLQGN